MVQINHALARVLRPDVGPVQGQGLHELLGPADADTIMKDLDVVRTRGAALRGSLRAFSYATDHARWYPTTCVPLMDVSGNLDSFLYTATDVHDLKTLQEDLEEANVALVATAAERQRLIEKLAHQAQHDPLTQLANRALFEAFLQQTLRATCQRGGYAAVLYIDLDRFKYVNDTFGHHAGDELLCQVAARLTRCVSSHDLVARLGGDEFAVVLTRPSGPQVAVPTAEQILTTLATPFHLAGQTVGISGSVGIAVAPQDGADVDTVQRHADAAMYHAKHSGKNAWRRFTPGMTQSDLTQLDLASDLRHALERQEFTLVFQPMVRLRDGEPAGQEAFLRWNHPLHGLLLPERFLAVAQAHGLMGRLGAWVLEEACTQAAAQDDPAWSVVSVNVSSEEFERLQFTTLVRHTLQQAGLDPTRLQLEFQEDTLLQDPDGAWMQLSELRRLGVRAAVDRFNGDRAALMALMKLPLATVKTAPELLGPGQDHQQLTDIIRLTQNLDLEVIVLGVEEQRHVTALLEAGVHLAQGLWFQTAGPNHGAPTPS